MATGEPATTRLSSDVQAGWIYEVRVEFFAEREPSVMIRGAGEVDLPVTVAIAMERTRAFAPTAALAVGLHSVRGSTAKFKELFAGAFDLGSGARELLVDLDLEKFPFRAYALRNPSY